MEEEGYIADGKKYLANTYRRTPLLLVQGQGCKVWDAEGKEYLDFVAGIAVNNLGHCHPRVVEALQQQAARLMHVSNLYYIQPQIDLGQLLVNNSFAHKAFFCNSGAEAIEGAIKLARRYSSENFAGERYEIICMDHSFHGRTMGALSATGQVNYHEGYHPMLPGFTFVPYDDLDAVRQAITDKTCAILVEPIQGEGGVNIPSDSYLPGLRKICQKHKLLLIYDEIQTGMGRTGRLFAYEHYGAPPDIMTLAKGLAGGVPMGAILATDEVMNVFVPGSHASTFGGNPLACATALAAVETLLQENIIGRCQKTGEYFKTRLIYLADKFPFISDVRGKGLMLGLELTSPAAKIVDSCREKGFLINCTRNKVLRFLPPLIVSEKEIDKLIVVLEAIFDNWQPE